MSLGLGLAKFQAIAGVIITKMITADPYHKKTVILSYANLYVFINIIHLERGKASPRYFSAIVKAVSLVEIAQNSVGNENTFIVLINIWYNTKQQQNKTVFAQYFQIRHCTHFE